MPAWNPWICGVLSIVCNIGDPLAVIFDDEEHSPDELREIIIDHPILERLLLVSFTERGKDIVRIISAVFSTPAAVNKALRALVEAMPTTPHGKGYH